jgi:hypothetical protein
LRAKFIPTELRIAYAGNGARTGQVLCRETGVLAPGPNLLDTNRSSGNGRQSQRSTQYLATALTLRTVNGQHVLFQPPNSDQIQQRQQFA